MRVAVLFGGTNSERDVSIATAGQVFRALRERGHEVLAFDTTAGRLKPAAEESLQTSHVGDHEPDRATIPGEDLTMQLIVEPGGLRSVDVVFLALHGGTGENGTIQGVLDLASIRYTGSGVLPSALAMDKDVSKQLFRAAGIATPDWIMATSAGDVGDRLGYPVIVKANTLGSTIGLTVAHSPAQLAEAIDNARRYDREVMAERFVPGREFVVGVLGDRALAVGEIVLAPDEVFDYRSKYQADGAQEVFPAPISTELSDELRRRALMAHRALKLADYSRIDFRVDNDGGIWCLEANTLPGMTETSLLPQSAAAMGIGFGELCEHICTLALAKHRQ